MTLTFTPVTNQDKPIGDQPIGDTLEVRKKDSANKLENINSNNAKIQNPAEMVDAV